MKSRQEKLSSSLFRTMQIQNKKRELVNFISAEVDLSSDDSDN